MQKYYKSHTVGVVSEFSLTTDRDLSVLTVLKKHDVFYSSEMPEVTWYEPLYNRGPPIEILTDNDTAFTCGQFKESGSSWGVHLKFQCAHMPAGNDTAERCHRNIKTIATRKNCPMLVAVN